jgi:hypothetical protein
LSFFEFLHIKGPKTSVIKNLGHHPEGVTHKNLVDMVTRKQVSSGELDVVLVVRGRDSDDVLPHIQHQVMGVEQGQRKGMQPEQSE